MYEKLEKRLTPVCRLMIALVLFLAGLIRQLLSDKTLDQYAFYAMSAAALCIVYGIVCKISDAKANFILYVVLNLAILIIGVALSELESLTGVILYTVWGICGAADWIANAVLLACDNIFKRIVMGFAAMLMNIVFFAIIFMIPILIQVFL